MKVFISYRRDDSREVVDRIAGRLREEFGRANVFKDVDSIGEGENFLDRIHAALTEADVMLVVIGPGWLDASDPSGRRRLDDPDDWVRIEVREALPRDDVRVVPLLVEGAEMPDESALPQGLKKLAHRQARVIRPSSSFDPDLDDLCARFTAEEVEGPANRPPSSPEGRGLGGRPDRDRRLAFGPFGGPRGAYYMAGAALLALVFASSLVAMVARSRARRPDAPPGEAKAVAAATKPSRLFVLSFGTNDVPGDRVRAPLRFAEEDVAAVCDAFQTYSGPLVDSVACHSIVGAEATRGAVLEGLARLKEKAGEGDLTIVHFSGYEVYHAQGSLDRFFLELADFDPDNFERTTLSRESLADAVAGIPGRVIVLLDTCHAQAAAKVVVAQNPRACVFAASRYRELASESAVAQGGYFTSAIVTGLSGRADADKDGTVTLAELEEYVADRVGAMSDGAQHPILLKGTDSPPLALSRPRR